MNQDPPDGLERIRREAREKAHALHLQRLNAERAEAINQRWQETRWLNRLDF